MRRPALLLLALLVPAAAEAHHILGIPHYAYSENYPQIPFVEVMAQTVDHDLHFSYFPGTPRPGERVRFKLYVRERSSGRAFTGPLRLEVYEKRMWGGERLDQLELAPGTGPEAHDYKFFHRFETADAFELRLDFPTRDGVERIPFPVVIGRTDDLPLLGAAAGLLVGAALTVGVLKRRRRRA